MPWDVIREIRIRLEKMSPDRNLSAGINIQATQIKKIGYFCQRGQNGDSLSSNLLEFSSNSKVIYHYRSNIISQAISFQLAATCQRIHSRKDDLLAGDSVNIFEDVHEMTQASGYDSEGLSPDRIFLKALDLYYENVFLIIVSLLVSNCFIVNYESYLKNPLNVLNHIGPLRDPSTNNTMIAERRSLMRVDKPSFYGKLYKQITEVANSQGYGNSLECFSPTSVRNAFSNLTKGDLISLLNSMASSQLFG
jgi:hypothetical protein